MEATNRFVKLAKEATARAVMAEALKARDVEATYINTAIHYLHRALDSMGGRDV